MESDVVKRNGSCWECNVRVVSWTLGLLVLGVAGALLQGSCGPATAPVPDPPEGEATTRPPPGLGPGATRRPDPVASAETPVSISGHVLAPDGSPSPYARVVWLNADRADVARTRTDARGAFTLQGPEDDVRLRIEGRDGGRLEADLDIQDWQGLRLKLKRGRPLDGVVLTGKDRQPVAGAHVRMWKLWFGLCTAVTDETGAFRLAAVPVDDDFDVSVEAGAHGRTEVENVVRGEGVRLVVVLPEVRTLRGRVVCALTGRFVEGARVVNAYRVGGNDGGVCWSGTARDGVGAVTDSEGRFVYEGITQPGELEVYAKDWHLPDSAYEWCGLDDEVVLRVVPRVRVDGTVMDERGRPVAGAEVEIEDALSEEPVLSDAGGRFAIPAVALRPRGNVLEAKTADLAGWMRIQGRPGHPIRDVELRVERMATVTGTVRGEKGAPLARAEVHVWWRNDRFSRVRWAWTDDEGRFTIRGIDPGGCSVEAEAAGHQNVERHHDLMPGVTNVGEIRLEPLLMRDARVVDEDGAPIPSAWWRSRPYASVGERPVAADGTFRVATTREGKFFDLTVGAPDYLDKRLEKKHLPDEDPVVIVLCRAHYVAGRLLDLEGRPVTGARIVCRGEHWVTPYWGNRTDMAGRFRVKVGAPGPYHVAVDSECFFPPDVTIEADTEPTDVHAHPTCSIGGRVVGPDGRGIERARVGIRSRWEKGARHLWTDADGRFRVDDLLGRTFSVWAYSDDERLTFRPQKVVPPNSPDVLFVAERACSISGTVTWSDGRPAVEVFVDVEPVGHNADSDFEETDEQGAFCFTGLPAGAYEIDARTTVEVPDEEDQEEENDLEYDTGKSIVQAGAANVRLVLHRTGP